ncbi:MAG: hypothetical protein ACE5KD_00445 [Candidatus Bathyarchaeia archaeon]
MSVEEKEFPGVMDALNACKIIKDDVERAKCMFDLSHKVARIQESIYAPAVNESVALSNNLITHANALILEATKWRGDIRKQVMYDYTFEKVNKVVNDWNSMVHDYNVSHKAKYPVLICKEKEETFRGKPLEVPEPVRKSNEEMIFKKQDEINR